MNDHEKLSEETTVSRMAFDEMFKCADDYWKQLLEARKQNREIQTLLTKKVKTIMELEKKLSGQSLVEEVPPCIVSFRHQGRIFKLDNIACYEDWVSNCMAGKFEVFSISVDGVTYSVGEEVWNKVYDCNIVIDSFSYEGGHWIADYTIINGRTMGGRIRMNSVHKLPQPPERKIDGDFTKADTKLTGTENFKPEERKIMRYKLIKKYPGSSELGTQHFPNGTDYHDDIEFWQPIYSEPNPPVCELPDENGAKIKMHEGDKVWYVQKDFYLGWGVAQNVDLSNPYRIYFATEAAANQFVKYNKPVYPESLIEDMCNASDISEVNRMYTEYCKKHNL